MKKKLSVLIIFAAVIAAGCNRGGSDDEAAAPIALPIVTNAPLHTDGRWIKDSQGRAVILRGFNVDGNKNYPFNYDATEQDYDIMYGMGVNAVRLLIIWEGIEPMPGVFVQDLLLDKTAQQIEWAAQRGIYVILDMHQDLYGPPCGDGAPQWTDTLTLTSCATPWGMNYFKKETMTNFDVFWDSAYLQDHFTAAWLAAVVRFVDRPNVMGYDLYNEPNFGSRAAWNFERYYLGPFQDRVGSAIRAVDPDRIIFYEPFGYAGGGIASFLPPPALKTNVVYGPHFYDPQLGLVHTNPYDGNSFRMESMMKLRDKEALGFGNIPWLMGEFGIANAETDDPATLQYMRDIYEMLDKYMISGTYWSWGHGHGMSPINSDGSDRPRVQSIVRPFPMIVAGEPLAFSFDQDTKIFTLTIKEDPTVPEPTEVYIPESRHYPNGFTYESTGNGWHCEYDGRILKWYSDNTRYSNTLTVKPLPPP